MTRRKAKSAQDSEQFDLESAKKEMLEYSDWIGGKFQCPDRIKAATTGEELAAIFREHHDWIGDITNDVQAALFRFQEKIGVTKY